MSTSFIIAIDPGWLNTGWCIVKRSSMPRFPELVDAGVIMNDKRKARSTGHAARTRMILSELGSVLEMYSPKVAVFERNLGSRSVKAAVAMRSAFTIVVAALHGAGIAEDFTFEVTPQSMRKAVTGKGTGVPKEQMHEWILAKKGFDLLPQMLLDQGVSRSRHEHALDAALIAYLGFQDGAVKRALKDPKV